MDEEDFRRRELSSTVAASAVKAELGDLFEYRIDHPVTIRKSESAMLPFFRERVDARRLYIYDESNGSQHPLNAAEITNSSGATLDGGAITVYDAGAYAGEALVETIKAGDKRLISYAVDLGTRITTDFDSTSKLQQEFHFRRGVMNTKTAMRETKTFTIRNVDDNAKTIILEHPVRPGYELIDGEPAEKTSSAYRFEVPVEADSTTKFAIVEERMYDQQLSISNMPYEQLISWTRNKNLDEAGRQKLQQIADLKRQIADTQQEEKRVNQRVQEMNEDQSRLRNNISTLRSVTGPTGKSEPVRRTARSPRSPASGDAGPPKRAAPPSRRVTTRAQHNSSKRWSSDEPRRCGRRRLIGGRDGYCSRSAAVGSSRAARRAGR